MATPLKLNTTTSVVDFLKSGGQDSSFGSREKLYKEKGLESRLGKYVGSGAQNIAFLKTLQGEAKVTPSAPIAPVAPVVPVAERTIAPTGSPSFSGTSGGVSVGGLDETFKPKVDTTKVSSTTETPVNVTATDALKSLGIPSVPSEQDLIDEVFQSPSFKLFSEKQAVEGATLSAEAEAEKSRLEGEAKSKVKEVEESFGRRGLFMSGMRSSDVQSVIESLAASKLGVDRKLATKMLNQNLDLRKEIIDGVSDVAKKAQEGRKEAISALEKVGLTVVGNQIVPTLESQRFTLSERRADLAEERAAQAEARAAEADRRAEAHLKISEENLALAKKRLNLVGQFLTGQAADQVYDNTVQQARSALNENRGTDGKIDPGIFKSFRDQIFRNMPSKLIDFDKEFVPQLSPEERTRLNVVVPGKGNSQEVINQTFQDLQKQFIVNEGLD